MREATNVELMLRAPFDESIVKVSKRTRTARVYLIKGDGKDSEQNACIDLSFDESKDSFSCRAIAWEITQQYATPLLKPFGAVREWENMDNDGGRGVN